MEKNLLWKKILIVVLVAVAIWTLYPPAKTLKPGIDLAGGTSLIYEIDSQGLKDAEKKDLAQRMITVLRRRIDPGDVQHLVWRIQGNDRFEIQMPLASSEARIKRQNFEKALSALLAENTNPAAIMRSLKKPAEERAGDFEKFAKNDPNRLEILQILADTYGQRKNLQQERDQLDAKLKTQTLKLQSAGLDPGEVKRNLRSWAKLDEQKLAESLKEFSDSGKNIKILTEYVKTHAQWASVVEQLTNTETGKNVQYKNAKKAIDDLNLTEDQVDIVLQLAPNTAKHRDAIANLKAKFADRAVEIDNIVVAFDAYRPFMGRLDDPKDLQRMLKGAGILEFRILPTQGNSQVDADEVATCVEALKTKGPKFASSNNYVWCEVENADEARKLSEGAGAFVEMFGEKHYVLTSNKKDETILHSISGEGRWKLEQAKAGTESRTGRRAIDFVLDERGGKLFANVTGKNINRPLCILLDGVAMSAPNIQSKIFRRGQITGSYTQTDIEDMVNKLNAGSLPARLIEQPISVRTIGPSIGAENRNKGVKAGLIGLATVVVCMAGYYMLAGSIADIALLLNLLFVLSIMALLRATFTLPGIAGIILTIGMSVDANVLIFERIREEQQRGSSLRIAIQNGYQKAFSTILDANLTTFITAWILYLVAPEEVKGFAIVLMLGIASSMFTALFVTRTVFDFLLAKGIIKDHLYMLRLIHKPNINWMRLRPVFLTISSVLMVAGLFVFFTRDDMKNNKYDIEFTGGTSVQINLIEPISRDEAESQIRKVGKDLNNPALAAANVYSIGKTGKQYEINTTETNKTITTITFPQNSINTIESIKAVIDGKLDKLVVKPDSKNTAAFIITTSQVNNSIVKNVLKTAFADVDVSEPKIDKTVNDAILTAFADNLEIQQNLHPKIVSTEKITEKLVEKYPELADFIGGIKIECEIGKAATTAEIDQRLRDLRFKLDMRNLNWYSYKMFIPSSTADILVPAKTDEIELTSSFVYVSTEPDAGLREVTQDQWSSFVENETTKVLAATQIEASLPRVTQINPFVGEEAKTQAKLAIVLSLFAIIAYVWIRFGTARYGVAAIVALLHDVCITLGAVTACTYLATTPIGEKLLIGDFKINQVVIAAFLTLIGYSLNDTIVIFDRIRENRHKGKLSPQIVNDSINQTISRTILTSFTTFIVILIMYIFGGAGMRSFTFAIGFGIIIGTYSSVAIAAPILLLGVKKDKEKSK